MRERPRYKSDTLELRLHQGRKRERDTCVLNRGLKY